MRNDKLKEGAAIAIKHSNKRHASYKTKYNHLKESLRFVDVLRELGYGVKLWKNITNKHVQKVVTHWADKGLSIATIKEYLSGVRLVARFWGNDRIAKDNSAFGLGKREYISNVDRSLPQETFDMVINKFETSVLDHDRRFAGMFKLQRYLGLRVEESMKFRPFNNYLENGQVLVSYGTKGGRDRILKEITPQGIDAIHYARSLVAKGRNLIPAHVDMTEAKFRNRYYARLSMLGVTRENAGASSHGNRHAYMHNRYEQMTMFPCRVKFDSQAAFLNNAMKIAGGEWLDRDRLARKIVKSEAGHGIHRNDVASQYLGSSVN